VGEKTIDASQRLQGALLPIVHDAVLASRGGAAPVCRAGAHVKGGAGVGSACGRAVQSVTAYHATRRQICQDVRLDRRHVLRRRPGVRHR
jgi:hypothetical protein